MNVSEDQLSRWARPPSETEEGRCQAIVSRITRAVRARFGNEVFIDTQGSYKNRTNVRQDSDVDVIVRHNGFYFEDIANLSENDKVRYWAGVTRSDYTCSQFKQEIQASLIREFGSQAIRSSNKCINVGGGSQGISADVVPCFAHKRFRALGVIEAEGIAFDTEAGVRVVSFPEQHYTNGVTKNDVAGRAYKAVVRILKNIRNDLIEQSSITQDAMPSFFLECLVWNVPNSNFQQRTYTEMTREVIVKLWNDLGNPEVAPNYAEVSDLLWLFKGQTRRTPDQGRIFLQQAWNYAGYT